MKENMKRFRIDFTVDAEGWSDDSIEKSAIQELTCMVPLPEDISFSEVKNREKLEWYQNELLVAGRKLVDVTRMLIDRSWHTGTPTEEGWYLLHYPESKEQPYELAQWDGEHFVAVKPFHAIIVRIEASNVPYWQKINEGEN